MTNYKDLENEIKLLKEFLKLDYISIVFEGKNAIIGKIENNSINLKLNIKDGSFLEVSRKKKFNEDDIKVFNFFIYRLENSYPVNGNTDENNIYNGLNGVKSEIEIANKKLKEEIVKILLKTIETKDIETYEHSIGVAYYSKKIAEKYGLNPKQIEDIEYASYLHDIGKLTINEQILYKPTKLREDEFELIKKHPEIGYKILSNSESLRNIANFVLLHHEWFNGMGYPYGLKGDNIPIEAQIISISDYIATILQGRNYFERKETEDLIKELNKLRNVKFKDELVEKAIEVLKEKDKDV
jgi:putative nucleotidyltransferase with HDIG domain